MRVATVLLGAFLLFLVQPIIAKAVLPWFGGAPAVWTTCMLFFQSALVLGYLYAQGVLKLGSRRGPLLHAALLAAALPLLPIHPGDGWKPSGESEPQLHLLGLLAVTVGLPYVVLAATAPLVQAWVWRESGREPWRLYAVSNAGSLLALLAYPTVVEPRLAVPEQGLAWSWMFGGFAVLVAACAALHARSAAARAAPSVGGGEAAGAGPAPDRLQRFLWPALSACAVVLLLATTSTLCQDVAVVPFLWILPLGLYLASMILAFAAPGLLLRVRGRHILLPALAVMALALARGSVFGIGLTIVMLSVGLFVTCYVAHAELVLLRPHPRHLASFYLWIAAGGAMGGIFVSVLAPLVLRFPFELQIGMAGVLALVALAVYRASPDALPFQLAPKSWLVVSQGAAAVLLVLLAVQAREGMADCRVLERNFFGTVRIRDLPAAEGRPVLRVLWNGGTRHGQQFVDPLRSRELIAYYGPSSGAALVLGPDEPPPPRRIGVIGLGAGMIVGYGRPGDFIRFYEINPLIIDLARREFTWLRDSAATVEIVRGDARLALEREPDQAFDVFVVDAFSGDAIPVHLLSIEALRLYFRHLRPDGTLLLHVSSHTLDLEPVVARILKVLGRTAWLTANGADADRIILDADWIICADPARPLPRPRPGSEMRPLREPPADFPVWTDTFSNILAILK